MATIPDGMKSELAAWNEGRGISLRDWTANSGNFSLAVGYSEIFWPRFVTFEKYILVDGFNLEGLRSFERNPEATRQSIEWVMNHFHIADIQHSACTDIAGDKLAILGERLREIYIAKLGWLFPDRTFVVELVQPESPDEFEDYQISFFQT
ncbi:MULTISPECIES: hypothetical protein [unclassified Rhizobium]|uniref:hypothetical protein n=1 Tax=unclassified Rhizobium TaxID=2613769 RepID=UPI0007F05C74|nr:MULTISPECIES: hypothetical protein [unclassified Rhizobium]ANM09585.1 hypothetical protein AMK05_CH01161 [Rhizobium sp. N324]ANM16054.1 hypothetical protein AMK06_CH01120 [Rhizobium sp. N541]ANM22442.1 hypothetical protein AMK07_CH01120 [Rhizobium sp. N941]OYD03154.1 hypothetical protein AMK08_CH101156 [Rhizobium sp. N4311]